MPNPQIQQGTLNRLRGTITWASFPQLNITPAFLGEEAVRLTFSGRATTIIKTLTGTVTSPEPYQPIEMAIHLLKTQSLSDQYKTQQELSTLIGDCTFRTDAATLSPYQFYNMAIMGVNELTINGQDAGYRVSVSGYYPINSSLWG